MTNYPIERLSAANIHHLQTLYRSVFGRKMSIEFFLKKYDTKFTGVEFVGYVAFAPNGTPAAFYGVIPCFLRIQGVKVLAAQSADTMTHPDHRRAGLFLTLAGETYRLAAEKGIRLIFGFPNENSLPGFMKLNWIFLPANMKVFMLRASRFAFKNVLKKIPLMSKAHDNWLRSLYPTKKKAGDFVTEDGVIKDPAFVDYKKYSNAWFVEIDETLVWLKADGTLKVGYIAWNDRIAMPGFLLKLKLLAIRAGCSQVMFVASDDTELFKQLSKYAQPTGEFPIGIYPLSDGVWNFSGLKFNYCDIDIF